MVKTVSRVIGRSGILPGKSQSVGSVTSPIDAEQLEQLRREHHLTIFVALALTDTDDLSLTVDIRHLEVGELGNA
jgi:hypothetical protein